MRIAIADIVFITAANASGRVICLADGVLQGRNLKRSRRNRRSKNYREIATTRKGTFFGQRFQSWGYFRERVCLTGMPLRYRCPPCACTRCNAALIKYNGMTAEKFVWAWIKSEFLMPKKLVFHSTNTYFELMKPSMEQKSKEVLKTND